MSPTGATNSISTVGMIADVDIGSDVWCKAQSIATAIFLSILADISSLEITELKDYH